MLKSPDVESKAEAEHDQCMFLFIYILFGKRKLIILRNKNRKIWLVVKKEYS